MPENNNIERIGLRYLCQSAAIIVVLCIATVATAYFTGIAGLKAPLIVSAVFSLVIDGADGLIWTRVAKSSPQSLTTFYTAVSGFRMLIALFTLFCVYLAVGRDNMTEYCIVFLVFYFVLLAHHSVFFSRVSVSHSKCDNEK